jgi:hypothetical protein
MTHAQLVQQAVIWLRAYRCGVILSEQCCANGEMPDAIGWKRACHSVLIECKISRSDFLADREKPFRQKSELGLGCERFYLAPPRLLRAQPPYGKGISLRNESPAGKSASCGDSRRAPDHHRVFEMEKPYAGLQRRQLARRNHTR